MTTGRSRYFQAAVFICVCVLAAVAWMHSTGYFYAAVAAAEEKIDKKRKLFPRRELKCPEGAILCGEEEFGKDAKLSDFNTLRSEFHRLMTTMDFQCPTTLRFGRDGDGGYEACMARVIRPNNNSCLVYSFGVSQDWSFDEAWAKYGCEVHSFDPRKASYSEYQIQYLAACPADTRKLYHYVYSDSASPKLWRNIGKPDHMHAPNISFHSLGLWGSDHTTSNGWKLERLSTIRKRLGHEERIIDALKVDVEGAEWPFLRDVIYSDPYGLSNVRQLYIELHTPKFNSDKKNMTATDFAEINDYVRRLRDDLDFQLYKNVQNNYCCARFTSLMPPGVPEKCCHEVFFFNPHLLTI